MLTTGRNYQVCDIRRQPDFLTSTNYSEFIPKVCNGWGEAALGRAARVCGSREGSAMTWVNRESRDRWTAGNPCCGAPESTSWDRGIAAEALRWPERELRPALPAAAITNLE
ncbi:hypothetical protein TUM20985_50360 [Mycobacterium antarcticum]|nr:hypothetical protein TUM20985_50360 [Mycolicibacterium sp. TUM20985]GLP77693.1 hypothetical protein TUM20983_48030 [Mycolicibacterium sp. TUM20983]GLP81907.1 hypothetical protein TUM20984_33270 [Mycolicibacterium sp. TUM20984]